jgi:hypothetical protein
VKALAAGTVTTCVNFQTGDLMSSNDLDIFVLGPAGTVIASGTS